MVGIVTGCVSLVRKLKGTHTQLKFPFGAKEDVLKVAVDDSDSGMFPLVDHFGVEVNRAQQITGVSPIALSSEQGIESGAGNKKSETPLLIEQDY